MKHTEMELPSNRKFGFFFTFVFLIVGSYLFVSESIIVSYAFFSSAVVLFLITFLNENALYPFNKLWMKFGLVIGVIINPIILGIIFFFIITPYGLVMRIFGRDELILKNKKRKSYWKLRKQLMSQTNFKQQF